MSVANAAAKVEVGGWQDLVVNIGNNLAHRSAFLLTASL
jgi:hypothetical protein